MAKYRVNLAHPEGSGVNPGVVGLSSRPMSEMGSNASVQPSRHVGFTPDSGRIAARQRTDASGHFRKLQVTRRAAQSL
jgi:hypothetical protein